MVDGSPLTFEVFGLRKAVFTMLDRQQGSVWNHLDGTAIEGPMKGERMAMIPVPQMTWGQWKALHADTLILSDDTPFRDRYRPVRIGMPARNEALFGDDRLPANALVVGVEVVGQFKGYPLEQLRKAGGVVNDDLAGRPVMVFYDGVKQTGLAYSRAVDGRALDFYNAAQDGFELHDLDTNSVWDTHGVAIAGPLAGVALQFVPSFISEWYGWSAYHPQTALYEADPK